MNLIQKKKLETIIDDNPNQSGDHDQDVNKNEATDDGEEATDIGDHSTEVRNVHFDSIGWVGKLSIHNHDIIKKDTLENHRTRCDADVVPDRVKMVIQG